MSNAICKKGHPIGVPFCKNPEDHVDDRDQAKLAYVGCAKHLGNERDYPKVEATVVDGPNVELFEDGHDLGFNHVPEGLEELNREAIWTRSRGRVHASNGIPHLALGERGREGRILRSS